MIQKSKSSVLLPLLDYISLIKQGKNELLNSEVFNVLVQ